MPRWLVKYIHADWDSMANTLSITVFFSYFSSLKRKETLTGALGYKSLNTRWTQGALEVKLINLERGGARACFRHPRTEPRMLKLFFFSLKQKKNHKRKTLTGSDQRLVCLDQSCLGEHWVHVPPFSTLKESVAVTVIYNKHDQLCSSVSSSWTIK